MLNAVLASQRHNVRNAQMVTSSKILAALRRVIKDILVQIIKHVCHVIKLA
jgi:hypothetical protein